MHWFDSVVTALCIISGIWSLFRGLVREVLSLGGLIAALALALRGSPYLVPFLESHVTEAWMREAIAFAVIFLVVMTLSMVTIRLIRAFIRAAGLSLFDRLLGGVFGVLKVVCVVSVCFILGSKFFPPFTTSLVQESVLAPAFMHTAEWLARLLEEHDYTLLEQLEQQGLPFMVPAPAEKSQGKPEAAPESPSPPGPETPVAPSGSTPQRASP